MEIIVNLISVEMELVHELEFVQVLTRGRYLLNVVDGGGEESATVGEVSDRDSGGETNALWRGKG